MGITYFLLSSFKGSLIVAFIILSFFIVLELSSKTSKNNIEKK